MSAHDELRALVASEYARTGSGFMEMIAARLDADRDRIADMAARLAAAEDLAERYGQTIDWNLQQHERALDSMRKRHAEANWRQAQANKEAMEVMRRVVVARMQGRKTVRIADLTGEAS